VGSLGSLRPLRKRGGTEEKRTHLTAWEVTELGGEKTRSIKIRNRTKVTHAEGPGIRGGPLFTKKEGSASKRLLKVDLEQGSDVIVEQFLRGISKRGIEIRAGG